MNYPHLTGDTRGVNAVLLMRLERLGARLGQTITITSGRRSTAKQQYLYNNRNNPAIVKYGQAAPPGSSQHEYGTAVDATIDGQDIQIAVKPDVLRQAGLIPVAGDLHHVQLYETTEDAKKAVARAKLDPAERDALDWLADHQGGFNPVDAAAGAAGDVVGAGADLVKKGASKAAQETAEAVVGLFAGWMRDEGLRALLYVALVGGGFVLLTMGVSRTFGARREVRTDGV